MTTVKNQENTEMLALLKKAIDDYSYPERRYPGIVNAIDERLTWACLNFIHTGIPVDEVRDVLGEPHAVVGSDEGGVISWFYPCLEKAGMEPQKETDWYQCFNFREGVLLRVEKKRMHLFQ
ncbi:MAG TPA: hypothetical protein VIU12_24870 [Chryseolinea sp.]